MNFKNQSPEKNKYIDKSKDIIVENYVFLSMIGSGAFGQIYLSYDMRDNTEVAVKKEIKKNQRKPQVQIESKIYQELLNISSNINLNGSDAIIQDNVQGVPKFYGVGECLDYYYLIIEFLGPNLIELFKYCNNKKFSVITLSLLAIQILNRIENLHKHNYIHRDIKPENFLIGTGYNSNILYLIDFGLSKRYNNPKTHQHIQYKEGRTLTGTARYVSINTHLGIEQSRRDDLESIGYVIIFFLKGVLPWQGLKDNKNKYKKIMEKKLQIPTEILCFGLPEELTVYLNYCKSLKFEERPNYDYLRGLFLHLLNNSANAYCLSKDNFKFDWCYEDKKELLKVFKKEKEKEKHIESSYKESSNNGNVNIILIDTKCKLSEINEEVKKEELLNNNPTFGDNNSNVSSHKNSHKEASNRNNTNIDDISSDLSEEEEEENEVNSESSNVNSQETIKIEFNGKVKAKELEEENNIDFNDILNSMVNTEKIDEYINNLMQIDIKKVSSNNPIINKSTLKISNSDANINQNLTFKMNSPDKKPRIKENIDFNPIELTEEQKQFIDEIKKKELEKKKQLIEKLKNLTMEPPRKKEPNARFEVPMNHKNSIRSSLKHLSEAGIKKNIELKLQKEQYITISRETVTKNYQIFDNLGQGSYGKVKKVYHLKLGEFRAMKIVNKKLHSSHNEIEILRKISHPNIVNIFEIYEDKTKYYIMSEFCEGGELFTAIAEKGFFNEFEASRIIKQILQAINYLHSNSIVHRDLKPENIMFMSNFKDIKLIDFGTAIELPKRKKLTKLIGTSYYLAPEVIAENYDEKCDVWSCGIILYILLCGYPPFNGVSNNDIYNAIRYSKLNFNQNNWSNISKEAITLITKMLEKNPKKRISAEEGLNDFWFKKVSFNRKQTIGINQFEILERMALFVQQNKFKQAVLQFISTQFNLKKEEEELKQVFKEFDKEGKGVISREDFIETIDRLYGDVISLELMNEFYSNIDLDNSGSISYNEFLTSVIDSKKILTEDRLRKAFDMFDKDSSGTLDIEEIKGFFGGNENTWKRVLKDVDTNGDGQVDFQEFKKMMIGFDPDEIVAENTVGKNE